MIIATEIALLVLRGSFPGENGVMMRTMPGTGVKELGIELYSKYLVPFEIASVLLLVGLIGAVLLAKKDAKE